MPSICIRVVHVHWGICIRIVVHIHWVRWFTIIRVIEITKLNGLAWQTQISNVILTTMDPPQFLRFPWQNFLRSFPDCSSSFLSSLWHCRTFSFFCECFRWSTALTLYDRTKDTVEQMLMKLSKPYSRCIAKFCDIFCDFSLWVMVRHNMTKSIYIENTAVMRPKPQAEGHLAQIILYARSFPE